MGHVVPKSGISLTKVEQNVFLDIKLTEHLYCVACALLYSTVAGLALLKGFLELQKRFFTYVNVILIYIIRLEHVYLRDIPNIHAPLHKAGQI